MLESIFILICLVFTLHYYVKHKFSQKNLPPGPLGIPIFGTIFTLGSKPYLTFERWAQKYGPLVRTKFGTQDVLIIHDPTILRKAFSQMNFNGRMDNKINSFHAQELGRGMLYAEGEQWIEQRRFALRTLRDFGFGKTSMEVMILDEVNDVIKWIKSNEGKPINVTHRFVLATVNSLWRIIAGERHEQDDPFISNIINKAEVSFNELQTGMAKIYFYFPKLIDILPSIFLGSWYRVKDSIDDFRKSISTVIEHHIQNPTDENNTRDYIDVFLHRINKTTDPKSSFYGKQAYLTLLYVLQDLYGAGSGTTSSTLSWATLLFIKFPNVLKKFQQELDEVIGKAKIPTLSDRINLPYTEALINEILRFTSLVPLGLMMNKTTEDILFEGYFIKKDTQVIGNFYSVHYNKKVWGDPFNFRPERFLSSDGLKVIKNENLMAFNVGKRQCIGETLARDTIFLFLTNIFHKFDVFGEKNRNLVTIEPENGIFRNHKEYKAVFQERKLIS